MAGVQVTVIDPMTTSIPNGKVFNSKRDLLRAMKPNQQIGVEMDDKRGFGQYTVSLATRTYRVEAYEKVVFVPGNHAAANRAAAAAARTNRPGRTVWKVVKAQTSGLTDGAVFNNRTALARAAKVDSRFVAEDLATGKKYQFSIARATYRAEAI